MTERPWRMLLTLVVLGGLLVACGDDPPDDGESDAQEGDEIVVWIMQPGSEDVERLLQDYTASFEEETGASVDLQFVPWVQAHDQFTTAIAAGETPDVAEMGTTWTAEFGALGVFASQEEEVADEEYVEAVVESGRLEGEALGLPWYAGARALLYRTDVFAELGMEPPATWDEFVAAGQRIQQETEMNAFAASVSPHTFLPMVWQAGGEIAEEVAPGQWEARLHTPEAVQAFDFYASLQRDHGFAPAGALNWDAADARAAFFNEDAAMLVGLGVDVSISLDENPELEGNIGVAPLPAGPAGINDTFAGGSHLVVFEGSDAPGTAQAYAEFLLEPERISEFADSVGFFPGTVDGVEAMELDQHEAVFAQMLVENSQTYPPHPAWGGFEGEELFINAMQEIIGGRDAQEVLNEVSARMDAKFAE